MLPLDSNLLALTLLVTIGMQLTFFSIAWTCKFDKVTDIAGSMNFVLIAWLTFLVAGTYHTRQIVILAMVTVWGCRLGLFLLYRVLLRGKDERFDEIRVESAHCTYKQTHALPASRKRRLCATH